jgi:hypothetical protein
MKMAISSIRWQLIDEQCHKGGTASSFSEAANAPNRRQRTGILIHEKITVWIIGANGLVEIKLDSGKKGLSGLSEA